MQTFLQQTTAKIFERHSLNELKDVCVILPSRRATFFFKRDLGELSEVPFISPQVYAIDDFVCELSGLQLADPVTLLFELYQLYSRHEDIPFNEFITWGNTVLKDFDLIDQYLVPDVKALFNYMSEAEALSRWEPDSSKPIVPTENTASYFKLYDTLSKVYYEFRQTLIEKGLAFRGMAYRLLAEDLERIVLEDLAFSHFYFVGLNALSKSEERIISRLVKAGKATCYWDTDTYFMNSRHQAGEVLNRYRKSGIFGEWNAPENLLLTADKEVNLYECSFETLQSKVGADLLDGSQTVFVVPDENLIQPLLFSLDKETTEYNITMGLGMGQSKISVLINAHFDLHTLGGYDGEQGMRYNHQYVQKILSNPLVRLYEEMVYPIEKPFQNLSRSIIDKNKVFLTEEDFNESLPKDVLIKWLIMPWKGSANKALMSQKKICEVLQDHLLGSLDVMEKEFFILFYGVLKRLEDEVKALKDFSIESLKGLMKELVKQQRVPFTGEPVAPLQIMSLLETRCLDFEHVVLYSFNEGVIPSSQKNSSLIPYEACKEYGIPVFSDQDSIMAYHFYRLMMRAKKVDIIYTKTGTSGIGGGKEKSRFVLQLINSLVPKNPKIKLQQQRVDFKSNLEIGEKESKEIVVKKDEELILKIREYLGKKGLSASSMSIFYECSLKFYFSKLLGLKDQEEVEETFGYDVFGNWIHYSIERISNEIIKTKLQVSRGLQPKVIAAIPRILNDVFSKHFAGYQSDRGINVVYRKMAHKLLKDYYEKCFFSDDEKMIVASELPLRQYFTHKKEGIPYFLNGNIDSVEIHNNELVLIDFKTGKVENSDLNAGAKQDFQEAFEDSKKSKFRQMMIYKYLAKSELDKQGSLNGHNINPEINIISGMYSFRDLSSFAVQKDIALSELKEGLEAALETIVSTLLNNETPFTQTEDTKKCEYCSFNTVCNKV
ncbi:MAG: PD-(D/E)XK nuclease family protein [Cytophagales bacterium]|nr:PD-(D/E)XK nuclease family protein [Cytophagales bacterium]